MDSDVLVQVESLYRYYGNICAVHGLNLTLRRGEVLGFLGPNGAGKSTTMQLLTGNLALDAGRIIINGHDLLDEPRHAKSALGYLPEQPPLYRELSVDEYLGYCARLHRLSRSNSATAIKRTKERCGLEQVGRRLIGNLSKGYQQRVGIAQAILHSPAVVILDEPTVGLDPIQIREIRTLIKELGQEHGVILSTHTLPEVQATCSHVQVINQGRLIYADSLAKLDQRQENASLILGFDTPPTPAILAQLPDILQVETLSRYRFRLYHTATADPAPTLVTHACTEGWGLRELTPERKSLEQIFIDLTLGHDAREAA